jgi:hypothetical protein
MVAALVVILLASATARALIASSHFSGDQRFRSTANALATQDQERLRGLSDYQLNGLNQSRAQAVNGSTFTVASKATYLDTTGSNTCSSTSIAYYKISSTVTWTESYNSRQDLKVTTESVLSRPVTGDLRVQVNDQTLSSLSGVAVTAAGPDTQSSSTDGNGCVLFAGLSPGNYTVALADPGYVDPDGHTTPTNATATVTATGTAAPAGVFHLGRAGSIVGSFTTSTPGAGGESDGLSWVGAGASITMSVPFNSTTAATPSTSLTTGSLFPFNISTSSTSPSYTGNYSVWAGRCLQQEPPAAYNHYTVMPGSTGQGQTVQEPLLAVNSVTYAGALKKPDHIKLSFNPTQPTTSGCAYSWAPTLVPGTIMPATGWLQNPGQPFASTATTGASASASSNSSSPEAGTITVCADYNGYSNTVTTTNASFSGMNTVPTIAITTSSPSLHRVC